MSAHLNVLLVDDEPLARNRLRSLLAEPGLPPIGLVAEAGSALSALDALQQHEFDLVLLDIHMPGVDGLSLAHRLGNFSPAPCVVFVTAHDEHAVQAFELEAVDYLTKPVRRERLIQALNKVLRQQQVAPVQPGVEPTGYLLIQDRGRTERVAIDEVLYLKAELKYLTVRTAEKSHIFNGSLSDLETQYPDHWLRIHRNALVARTALRALEHRHDVPVGGDGWFIRLNGVDETLPVSRRQLAAVRLALAGRH